MREAHEQWKAGERKWPKWEEKRENVSNMKAEIYIKKLHNNIKY